jgi:hypothetical protein
LYSFPPLANATRNFIKNAMVRDHVVLFHPGQDAASLEEMTRIAARFRSDLIAGILNCASHSKFCQMFSVWSMGGTQLILVHPKKNVYNRFQGKFTGQEVEAWITRAVAGKERAFGPGSGVAGLWFNFKTGMQKKEFRLRVYAVIAGMILLACAIWAAVSWVNAWLHKEEIKERKKLLKLAEERLEQEAAALVEDLIREDEIAMKKKRD